MTLSQILELAEKEFNENWKRLWIHNSGLPVESYTSCEEDLKSFIKTQLTLAYNQGNKTKEVKIKWETSEDELYTYFGKCECGNGNVITGSRYCSECGGIIYQGLEEGKKK